MKQNTEDYTEQYQESNPRHFEGFTFYGETPEVSGSEDSRQETQPGVSEGKSFPLAMASVGEKLRIVKLKGSEGTVRRLIGMGLVPAMEVHIVSNSGGFCDCGNW
ncbi:MAG: FeoA family protein [Microcoleus sp.]